jgi:hypothetical protein
MANHCWSQYQCCEYDCRCDECITAAWCTQEADDIIALLHGYLYHSYHHKTKLQVDGKTKDRIYNRIKSFIEDFGRNYCIKHRKLVSQKAQEFCFTKKQKLILTCNDEDYCNNNDDIDNKSDDSNYSFDYSDAYEKQKMREENDRIVEEERRWIED